jgi:hypothetical protein
MDKKVVHSKPIVSTLQPVNGNYWYAGQLDKSTVFSSLAPDAHFQFCSRKNGTILHRHVSEAQLQSSGMQQLCAFVRLKHPTKQL